MTTSCVLPASGAAAGNALLTCRRYKGDYGFNVFHNSNPQHGGSYARHERRMRDDEVEDFMKSVKGWVLVREAAARSRERDMAELEAMAAELSGRSQQKQQQQHHQQQSPAQAEEGSGTPHHRLRTASEEEADGTESVEDDPLPCSPSSLRLGEEAIQRTFRFNSFAEAYLFMGRFWAFCYGSDKYPPVTWDGCEVTVYLYSPSFHGLSKREARVAAFLNDQYNMLKKSRWQQGKILDGVVRTATIEELVGEEVQRALAQREAARRAPLPEATQRGPVDWERLITKSANTRGNDGAVRSEEGKHV